MFFWLDMMSKISVMTMPEYFTVVQLLLSSFKKLANKTVFNCANVIIWEFLPTVPSLLTLTAYTSLIPHFCVFAFIEQHS